MPMCAHEGHKANTAPFRLEKGTTVIVDTLQGWNPILRRFEDCDPGLIPPRKPGKKKVLRHAGTD